jgi:hypothetical protein
MNEWTVLVDLAGTVPGDLIAEAMVDDGPVKMGHTDEAAETTQLRMEVQADTMHLAVRRGLAAFDRVQSIKSMVDASTLRVLRFTVNAADAYRAGLPILSTKGVAEVLEVSDARVRQLADQPDFPRALRIPGAVGELYDAAEVHQYKATRNRRNTPAGRPRATDEEHLRTAIQAVLDHGTLTTAQRFQLERALETTGGRFVRGKAFVLVRLPNEITDRVADALAPDDRDVFVAHLGRAGEIAG